MKHPETTFDP